MKLLHRYCRIKSGNSNLGKKHFQGMLESPDSDGANDDYGPSLVVIRYRSKATSNTFGKFFEVSVC